MKSIDILIIAGTEAYNLDQGEIGSVVDELVIETPFGSSAKISILEVGDKRAGFLSRHGEEGYSTSAPFVNYRANIYAGKELGAARVISWNGVGAINRILEPGDYIIPDDYIDATRSRDYTFYKNKGYGFIRQYPAFCPELRDALVSAARRVEDRTFDVGVYLCTEGPRLETKSEINMYAQSGADIVGMTLIPEVYLAKELEMCYASICYISNFAEGSERIHGTTSGIFSGMLPDEFYSRMKASTRLLPGIIKDVISNISLERNCSCSKTMDTYKQRGDIGEDWHEWISPDQ